MLESNVDSVEVDFLTRFEWDRRVIDILICFLSYPLVAIRIRFPDTHAKEAAEIAYVVDRVGTLLDVVEPVKLHPSIEDERRCCGRQVVPPILKVARHPRARVEDIQQADLAL